MVKFLTAEENQLAFGDIDPFEYTPDTLILGSSVPNIRFPEHSNSLMRRPFISWDGEGYTDEWGRHHYWLLANSIGDKIIAPPGRSIERSTIGRLFNATRSRFPTAINSGFALGYDFTMMIRSNGMTEKQIETYKEKNYFEVDGYMWRMFMGKQLQAWPSASSNYTDKFLLQDSWGFFQRSFVKALDEYFPDGWPYRDTIVEMKKQRAFFSRSQDAEVMEYNDMELELHVMLMEELRYRLYMAGMPISRWYGPGAIASSLMNKWRIKEKQVDLYKTNEAVASAAQHAYAGGRFELVKPGHVNGKVYQYDINSAYPYAIARLPNFADGEWFRLDYPNEDDLTEFSIVRLRWSTNCGEEDREYDNANMLGIYPESIPFPLFKRIPSGSISFPSHGIHGWYWYPEAMAAIQYGCNLPSSYGFHYTIEEAYCYVPRDELDKPFGIIHQLYKNRQRLKALNNGAHIGIKLGLNSLYGKLAQQVGWTKQKQSIPPYHNLAAAGYVTSVCRARMVMATMEKPSAIIAYETDGIFSSEPLSLPISSDLGDWDLTVWDDMWYFQSGFRFGIKDGEVRKPATRGVPVELMDLELIKAAVSDATSEYKIEQKQFITLRWAIARNNIDLAGQWTKMPKTLHFMNEDIRGKRIHDPDCPMCDVINDGNRVYRWDKPHLSIPRIGYEDQMNTPHKVLWSNPSQFAVENPEIDEEMTIAPIEP